MSDVLLAISGISFGYDRDRMVLRNVSLALRTGDRLGLTGPNGAGKTTLLHLLVGLLRPQSGHVEAFGHICQTERDFVTLRKRVGLMFQDPDDQLFCPTVIEDVAFGPLNLGFSSGEARRLALDALGQVGMTAYAERITHHLSAGEKKLIALATVLSMRPSVLLLDEPTAGLDPDAWDRVAKLLPSLEAVQLIVSQDTAFLARTTRCCLQLRAGTLLPAFCATGGS